MNDTTTPPLPLSKLRVLDLTLARAGPTCVRHLADWGAEVIRIEQTGTGSEDIIGRRQSPDFQNLHRNKRAIQLNLKSEEGHAIFMKLAASADVIVENMRAPVKHRLKIAYEDVKKVNPRIVYGSISGFGQDGPASHRAGVDQIAQGMGGLMSVTGLPGQGPVRAGIAVNDLVAGTSLAFGIMTALFERERTGVGRWVHTSLLETQVFLMDFQAARYLMKGDVAGQAGNEHPTMIPSNAFPTADGAVNISATSPHHWIKFCEAIGKPEWATKPEWNSQEARRKDRPAVYAAIGDVTRQKPTAHWVDLFESAGLPCGPINKIDQVFAEPQVQHLGIATPMKSTVFGDTKVVASPLNMSGAPRTIRRHTPESGEHTAEVMKELGYGDAEVAKLKADGVI